MSDDKKYLVQLVDAFDGDIIVMLLTASEIADKLQLNNLAGCYGDIRVYDVTTKMGELTEVPNSQFWYPSQPLGIKYMNDSDYYDWLEQQYAD